MSAQPGFVPHVATLGAGPRRVLALHCTMAFSGAWAGFAKGVGSDATLIAPDMVSHGQSADWDEQSNFPDTVFEASLACLDEPMDVIGHSFGGATALRMAVERPDLIRTLTMIEPVFFCVGAALDPSSMADHDARAGGFFQSIQSGNREDAARAFNRMWSEDGPPWASLPEYLRAAMTRAIHVVPSTVPFLYEDSYALRPRLEQVQVPTLILRGEHTLDIVKATNRGLAQAMPNASEAVISGAGHMAPITHPKDCVEAWRSFLENA